MALDSTRKDLAQDAKESALEKRVGDLETKMANMEKAFVDHDNQIRGLSPLAALVDKVSQILRHFGG